MLSFKSLYFMHVRMRVALPRATVQVARECVELRIVFSCMHARR